MHKTFNVWLKERILYKIKLVLIITKSDTKNVLWAYTASYKGVVGADFLRWMLDTQMHLGFSIRPLFHAYLLVLKCHYYWQQLTQPLVLLFSATAFLFKYRFHLCLAWQNTEYFEILNDKWRFLCIFLNVKISFTEDIIKECVMLYNFVHEREYCNSDPILWVDGLYIIPLGVMTWHTNYESNICDHYESYFDSSIQNTPQQYCKIWAFNHNLHPVYNVSFIMVKKKKSPKSVFTLKQTTQQTGML